jgi:hypothetical protein
LFGTGRGIRRTEGANMTEGPSEDMHYFVLRNYFRGILIMMEFHEIDFFTFRIISVNFLPFGIISVDFTS